MGLGLGAHVEEREMGQRTQSGDDATCLTVSNASRPATRRPKEGLMLNVCVKKKKMHPFVTHNPHHHHQLTSSREKCMCVCVYHIFSTYALFLCLITPNKRYDGNNDTLK
jgi:hypothetical protein